jgi:hypothetical protein
VESLENRGKIRRIGRPYNIHNYLSKKGGRKERGKKGSGAITTYLATGELI